MSKPSPSYFKAYLDERFPVAPYALLIGAMVLAATAAASLSVPGRVSIGYPQLLTLVSLMLGFFHLRVFDEHKDYEKDRIAHPDRVLSKGLITLSQLRRYGAAAMILQLIIGGLLGWHALLWTLAYMGFSLLMRVEFFVPSWLNRHIIAYAISHNPIVGLMMMFAGVVTLETTALPRGLGWFLLVATFTSLGFEIGRKLRAPADEKPAQDTYSKALSPVGAAALLMVVEAAAVVVTFPLLGHTGTRAALGVVGAVMLAIPIRYALTPTPGLAKGAENSATLGALVIYILVTVDICMTEGVTWA